MPRGQYVRTEQTTIRWTDTEWFDVGDKVWEERRVDPTAHLVELIRRAQSAVLVPERRKNVRTLTGMDRIVKRLADIDGQFKEDMTELRACNEGLQKKLKDAEARPTAAEVLGALTDQEVLERFRDRVFDSLTPQDVRERFSIAAILGMYPTPELVGFAVQQVMDDLSRRPLPLLEMLQAVSKNGSGQAAHSPPAQRTSQKHVVITIMGGDTKQQDHVRNAAGENATIHFIESGKNNLNIPRNTEWVIVWKQFTSHPQQRKATLFSKQIGKKMLIFSGGVKNLKAIVADLVSGNEASVMELMLT